MSRSAVKLSDWTPQGATGKKCDDSPVSRPVINVMSFSRDDSISMDDLFVLLAIKKFEQQRREVAEARGQLGTSKAATKHRRNRRNRRGRKKKTKQEKPMSDSEDKERDCYNPFTQEKKKKKKKKIEIDKPVRRRRKPLITIDLGVIRDESGMKFLQFTRPRRMSVRAFKKTTQALYERIREEWHKTENDYILTWPYVQQLCWDATESHRLGVYIQSAYRLKHEDA